MDNKYINIVYTADKNYTDIISVSMFSVLKNLSKDKIARFFVFSQDFNSNDIEKLNKLKKSYTCEIINVPMEPYLDFLNFADITTFKNKYISLACYFRLLIFKILPEYVKECFYIDGDMLVDTDISKIKLSKDKIFSAVIEAHAMQYREKILAHLKDYVDFKNFIINPLKFPYFNAGFFLVNLEKAKQINIMEDLLDFLKRYPNPPYADQDTLNAIFGQKYIDLIEYLPPEYNIFTSNDKNKTYDKLPYPDKTLKKAISKPKIIHYAGQNKPWNTLNVNHLHKYWKYWFKSPYKNIAIKYLTNILCKKFNQKLEKIKKTILAFVISYESNTLFLNPNSNINLTIKTLEFNKNNKNFIKNNKARKKRRLFLTTGNLSLLNTICVIKQTNEECDDYLFIHSHLKSDSFHTTCLKMAESHNFKKIYTLYEKILDFRQYFIHNKLYNFDEIYFSNQYQFLLLVNTLYKNTKKYITDEGCTGKLMRAKIFNYDKIKKFYFNDYSPKIDYWNLSKKNTKKIIKIDKQIFKSVTDEFAKKLPANINIDKNSKTILFCGSWYENTGLNYNKYIEIQNKYIDTLTDMGYKILFKPHPRDTREYIVNPSVEILDIQLPLECYNLDLCAVISFASSATLHLLTMQNMASFTIDLPIAKKGCKINENWISPLVKKMLLDYTTPISILIETNPSNLTKTELKKMLKNKCDNYINSLPKLSENKEFNKYAKELGFYVKR